ncbi:MAG: zf-HC2 domain-containing protein [bacterium]|nr:zf-HC2 domain-containing protein [bacterium]
MTDRCSEVLERLVEGVTGTVPPDERAAITGHLASCARCRDEAASLESVAARLRAEGRFVAPPGFWEEFMRRLADRIEEERVPAGARLLRWLASPRHALGTAVVTAVTVLAVFAAVRTIPPPPDPVAVRARGLVTATMTSSLPSLGEMLDTWRAGLVHETDSVVDRGAR